MIRNERKFACLFFGLMVFLNNSCIQQASTEIKNAVSNTERARQYLDSIEALQANSTLENANEITKKLVNKIDQSKSDKLISSKDTLLNICSHLTAVIDDIIMALNEKHGVDKDGDIMDSKTSKYVNLILIEQRKADVLRFEIQQSINQIIGVVKAHKLELKNEDLPMQLNFFMEEKGQTWQAHIFKDMPYGATMPIFSKLKNDITWTKLKILEALAQKI
jgi:DNA-binding Xre family transcriptional regulator